MRRLSKMPRSKYKYEKSSVIHVSDGRYGLRQH
jgi:hypothetical protein